MNAARQAAAYARWGRIPTEERFWRKVNKTDRCWLWTGALTGKGYGSFGQTPPGGSVLAHRFAYIREFGAIPDGLVIDHLCRERRCVNPAHLEAVTNRENVVRGVLFRTVQ